VLLIADQEDEEEFKLEPQQIRVPSLASKVAKAFANLHS
jgi:hypothetical protein